MLPARTIKLSFFFLKELLFVEHELPRDIEILLEGGSFGFYLWFDDLGHYIEDVMVGSNADLAGLKIGDRLLEVSFTLQFSL